MDAPSDPAYVERLPFLAGGGELGELIRAKDWTRSPLGSPHTWPKSLRTCVRIILTSTQPMFVWWGPELINLYNDAYKAIVGGKHPLALGQPAREVWREIWDQVEPRATSAMRDNAGTYDEALLLIMERNGYPEETYYTFSYSPAPNDDDSVGGIICANTDDTLRIVGQRQLKTLSDLGRNADARSAAEACAQAARTLAYSSRDLPFALVYLVSEASGTATLVGRSGIAADHAAAPATLDLLDQTRWPVGPAFRAQQTLLVEGLAERFGAIPTGAWELPPTRAAVVPIASSGATGAAAVLVVGLNRFRLFDGAYADFLGLVAGQIGSSVANAEAYERERQRAEELAELDRAKTTFFSNVSHEFRTPLTLMLGPLEDALRSPAHALSGENLDTTYRSSLRLLKLVNSLLDFSRIEAGRVQASFAPTQLGALTTDLASAFRSALERAGLELTVECAELPEAIYVDHDMWEKIVLNLLSNALKYTFAGGVRVSLQLEDHSAVLRVSDTGTGIPAAELPHVFERFRRVEGARSRTHEGTGIGLALVHELVRLHGGSIHAESTVDVGSTFIVRIPRGSAHLQAERLGAPRALASTATGASAFVQEALRWLPGAPPSGNAASLTSAVTALETGTVPDLATCVLVADDNADMREYVSRLLRERWSVVSVSDGAQALAAIREQLPDLVLTDVMMPNLDGFGLLSALRMDAKTRELPVIMLSARAGEESRVEGLEAGADDYLVKPFSARELLARVATHLQVSRLRAEAQRQRERLFEIFMQAPTPVAVLSGPDLRFEVANAPFCEMVARTGLVGRTLRESFQEPGAFDSVSEVERAFGEGKVLRVEERLVPLVRHGKIAEGYFSYVCQPIFEPGGKVDGIIVVATEVTESVLARQRVDGLRDAAERANRAKDEFLSTLSHELRTPLNAIVGWSRLLRTGSVPAESQARALETIERNARIQARLVEDMLDLSRIEQGKLVISVGPLEMVRVVEAAIDALRPAAEAKQIKLQPVLDSHATIVGDADRLQQVVWNLLSNAIKFTNKGGRVQIRLRRERSFVEVAVADNGQGIDPQFLPHVFDRFRQGDQSFTRQAGGLGLGLAIVRAVVELHGGEVTAHSEGRELGASFVVRLPVAPLRADSPGQPSPAASSLDVPPTFEAPPALSGLHVLVVDDEPETRALLQFVIEQCSARVTTAGSVPEGLAALGQGEFDLLISDIGMPGEDGYSFVRKVRELPEERRSRIPALALTAYARVEDRTAALRAGFNMHLAKPIDPNELLVVLETLVRTVRN
ncbi:MAG: response regulator [Myxococcales bacterium]|nr:MAG: response regulator [Myxococcales bacterium]